MMMGKFSKILLKRRKQITMALQFEFFGHTGFNFPFANFLNRQAQGHNLYLLFWESVYRLDENGFTVRFCMFVGMRNKVEAQVSRKMHVYRIKFCI